LLQVIPQQEKSASENGTKPEKAAKNVNKKRMINRRMHG
jgi:hypothetical protein